MSNDQRLQDLAARLTEGTQARKLHWTALTNKRFQLSLPTGAVVVETDDSDFPTMTVYDDSGNRVEALAEDRSSNAWDEALNALWGAARSSALNIDEVLDSIFKDVESATKGPPDEDIPF